MCVSEKNRLVFISRKFSDLYLMKIQICFYMQKNFKSVFNENTNKLFLYRKISDRYLMNIQIYFYMQKNFRYVFNENTDNFFHAKNHRSIFNM